MTQAERVDELRMPENLRAMSSASLSLLLDYDDYAKDIQYLSESFVLQELKTSMSKNCTIQRDQNAEMAILAGIRLRWNRETASNTVYWMFRTEIAVRENVRSGRLKNKRLPADIWRHRTSFGVLPGNTFPEWVGNYVLADLLQQMQNFCEDWRIANPTVVPVAELSAADEWDAAALNLRVEQAKQLLKDGKVFAKGCSEFVCQVLTISWENANSLMGQAPVPVGDNNDYKNLSPGDIVGWVGPNEGHVAVYVGEPGVKFIDVKEPGEKPRAVVGGYGPGRPLFKSARFSAT